MIFLDFDGVLFDTVREAYSVAVITSGKYSCIDEIDFETKHYKNFRKLRYLISPAWNYKYLLEELELNQDINKIKNKFLNTISNSSKKDYEEFENSFFNTREYLRKNHYEKWFKLNIPFPFLSEIEFLFSEHKNLVYIVTTKDKATVLKLLSLEGIEFQESRVFDKEDYEKFGSKKSIIESLIQQETQNIFIDDSDKHIKDCSQIKSLKCFQPNWGYIGLKSQTCNHKTIVKKINGLLGR
ncbi:HAD family hydrolase [Malaciobacter sp. WC5094]